MKTGSASPYRETEPKGPILANEMTWLHTVEIPAHMLPEHQGANVSGVYRICVVVFANSNLPGRFKDVIGCTEVLTERPV